MTKLFASLAAALVVVPSAGATTLRALVIRATWGPPLEPAARVEEQFREANAFFRRSSFGAFGLVADVTPAIQGFEVPGCFSSSETPGLGALADAAKAEARARGYELGGYDRFVYVFPEPVCGLAGLGVVRDVLLAGPAISWAGIVHELGHTLGLVHARGTVCAPRVVAGCRVNRYGDPLSPMGRGDVDFSAREKLELGWLSGVRRVSTPGTYAVGSPQEPGALPQALVVEAAAGAFWIEDVRAPTPRLVVRLVRSRDARLGQLAPTVYLTAGEAHVAVPGAFRVRRAAGELEFAWIDRLRPSPPRLQLVPRPAAGTPSVLFWRGAHDAGSGVARYQVRVDGRLVAITLRTSARLPGLARGRHLVAVTAVDRAGNPSRPARAGVTAR